MKLVSAAELELTPRLQVLKPEIHSLSLKLSLISCPCEDLMTLGQSRKWIH